MDPDGRIDVTDSELIRRFCADDDRQALAALIERRRGLAYRVALSVVRNGADAEDATQDAFLSLLAYAPRLRVEGSVAALVARMALRAAQHLARARSRRHAREDRAGADADTVSPDPIEQVMDREERRAVWRGVDALSDSYRLPILLHYGEGLSTLETANALGITHTAVRCRLSRGVARLRRELGQVGEGTSAAALLLLLRPRAAQAEPASLAARLQRLADGTARPGCAASPVACSAIGLLKAKLLGAGLVALASLGGISVLRQLPPPPSAGATPRASTPAALATGAGPRGTAHRGALVRRAPAAPTPPPGARAGTRPAAPGPAHRPAKPHAPSPSIRRSSVVAAADVPAQPAAPGAATAAGAPQGDPPAARILIDDFEGDVAARWQNLAPEPGLAKEGESSGKWAGKLAGVVGTRITHQWDAFRKPSLEFWCHSKAPTAARIRVMLVSDNAATEAVDGYTHTLPVDWQQWSAVRIDLATCAAVGQPAGLKQIDAIRFSVEGGAGPGTELCFDDMWLCERKVADGSPVVEPFAFAVPVKPDDTVLIYTHDAVVQVKGAAGNTLRVTGRKILFGATPEEARARSEQVVVGAERRQSVWAKPPFEGDRWAGAGGQDITNGVAYYSDSAKEWEWWKREWTEDKALAQIVQPLLDREVVTVVAACRHVSGIALPIPVPGPLGQAFRPTWTDGGRGFGPAAAVSLTIEVPPCGQVVLCSPAPATTIEDLAGQLIVLGNASSFVARGIRGNVRAWGATPSELEGVTGELWVDDPTDHRAVEWGRDKPHRVDAPLAVRLRRVDGAVHVRCRCLDLDLAELRGNIHTENEFGPTHLLLDEAWPAGRSADLNSIAGDIEATLSPAADDRLGVAARTECGTIDFTRWPTKMAHHNTSREIYVGNRPANAAADVRITTRSGNIRVIRQ